MPTRPVNHTDATTLTTLFDAFIRAGNYLRGWTPKTARIYTIALDSFSRSREPLSKRGLENWICALRERNIRATSCNVYIRSMNSFLGWLAEEHEQHIPRLKLLRCEQRVIETFSEAHLRALLAWKPRGFGQLRLWGLVHMLLDTGCRIEEALTLHASGVDWDNMLVTFMGKGRKERKIPFSAELRKTLWRYVQARNKAAVKSDLLFCTRNGQRLAYRNVYRDIQLLCAEHGISGPRLSPHTFRHTFATRYLRAGGDI